jgi:type IV secretory pathway VirJ component
MIMPKTLWSRLFLAVIVGLSIAVVLFLRLIVALFGEMPSTAQRSDNLPIVELPVPNTHDDRLAVVLSGDGGWADLDKQFGIAFQARGVATLGINCLRYFWKPRHPEEVSSNLERALRYYLAAWHKQRLLLVGYSFGANWLPFLVNRLPDDLRKRITLVALLSPGQYANLEIKVGDWIKSNIHRPGALPTQEEAQRMGVPTLCVWGTQDSEPSICPALSGSNVRKLPRPGGHHYDWDYASIEKIILGVG